ncbi:hypothetical protein I6H07_09635 [Hafnia alvei]|jgi:hypothetical protein|nr:hypothetical protein [Hafnia alvei]MBI0276082.1 hypothetical protein [Hafnia alvei]
MPTTAEDLEIEMALTVRGIEKDVNDKVLTLDKEKPANAGFSFINISK